jgi:iron complex outermembrane receptor protein
MSRSTPIVSTAALAVAMLWSAPAFAQDELSDSAESATEAATEITVTGTRIQRDGYRAPTPLTVLNSDDIESSAPA